MSILYPIPSIPCGLGTGDVVGPAAAVDGNIATFDTITGKLIKDSGVAITSIVPGYLEGITDVSTATYTVLSTDRLLHITRTSAGACAIELPTALVSNKRVYTFMDAGGNALTNNITFTTEGAETINGEATLVVDLDNGNGIIYSDGTNWFAMY